MGAGPSTPHLPKVCRPGEVERLGCLHVPQVFDATDRDRPSEVSQLGLARPIRPPKLGEWRGP
jgi:hypothetical protein